MRLFSRAALALLPLSGCAGLVAAGAGMGAAGGGLVIANQAAELLGNSLSDTAKLACAIQAAANLPPGNPRLSYYAGSFCRW